MGEHINEKERNGIEHLLETQATPELIISLAKIISKNLLKPQNVSGKSPFLRIYYLHKHLKFLFAEALDAIFLHSTSVHSILNRKLITKEILFNYLHKNKVPVKSEFTKQLLIDKIIEFWTNNSSAEKPSNQQNVNDVQTDSYEVEMIEYENLQKNTECNDNPEHFPINQMSRKFSAWFYSNLNEGNIQTSDFWRECECSAKFFNRTVCAVEETHTGDEGAAEFCRQLKDQYQLYFNLNASHSGTQGRIDRHGLVLVLSCGSLHKINELVGTFESVFALSRDPFAENNWKINRINFNLHNFGAQTDAVMPVLDQCQSLTPLLSLRNS